MKIYPQLFIGPVSKNVVDAVIDEANHKNQYICLIPSRRQIDYDKGYVNNWDTKEFVQYVRSKTDKVLIQRDHGGPSQGKFEDDGLYSLTKDAEENFSLIHIDPWKKYQDLNDAINITINCINKVYEINQNVLFEVGTEEALRKYSLKEFEFFLENLKLKLGHIFKKIKFASIQSGTRLEMNKNIGKFNLQKSKEFINICKKFNLFSKEHNGDYLSLNDIKIRFNNGLDAINIAPEFGFLETKYLLEEIKKQCDTKSYSQIFEICYESKKWVKWIPPHMVEKLLEENKNVFIETSCHYSFTHPVILDIKKNSPNLDKCIKLYLRKRIGEILCAIK